MITDERYRMQVLIRRLWAAIERGDRAGAILLGTRIRVLYPEALG